MTIDVTCPRCHHEFDLLGAREDDDWRQLIELILALQPVVHRSLWSYLGLFKGKSKLKSAKMLRIVKQLAPMIKAAQIERNHNTYAVPATSFARAMEYMVDSPPASLALPIKSNGYLLQILANNAETALAKVEQKTELKKQSPYRSMEPAVQTTAKQPERSQNMPTDFMEVAGRINPAIKKRLNQDQIDNKEVNNEQASSS